MKNMFYISDLHLGHKNIISYERQQFLSLEEMESYMLEKWNSVVKPNDRVYIVGDVVWRKKELPKLKLFNGKKVLYKGNHDGITKIQDYVEYFDDIRGCEFKYIEGFGKILVQHIPANENQFYRAKAQIHGHTHSHCLDDPRYFNVSCEVLDFTPIHIDQIVAELINRGIPCL